jgi:PqqD family protein of HPr-rel-A system
MKWRIHSTGRFYDANENTVVYFDSHSGDTHLLSDFAAFIMQQLGSGPLTSEQLVAEISPTVDFPDCTELSQVVEGILGELFNLDILKRE